MTRNPGMAILLGLLPAVMLTGGALVCGSLATLRPRTRWSLYRWIGLLMTASALAAAILTLAAMSSRRDGVGVIDFGGGLAIDRFAVYATVVVCAVLALSLLGSEAYMRRAATRAGAFTALLQLAAAAAVLLVSQREMAAFTVALALLGGSLVLLTAITKTASSTAEAAMRQLLVIGVAMATAFYGLVLVYAATGSTDLRQLASGYSTAGTPVNRTLSAVGIALVIVGVLAVVGATPLQQFIRHSVEAAPGAIAAFSAALGMVAGTAVLTRFSVEGFGSGNPRATVLLTALAAVAMLVGAVHALRADTIRRLIGDLTLAQAGFLLLAIAASGTGTDGTSPGGSTAALYLVPAGAAALLAALLIAGIFDTAGLGITREAYRGLGRRAPAMTTALSLALLGLAGLPPFAGFIGRVLITESTLNAGSGWAAAVAGIALVLCGAAVARWLITVYAEDNNEAPFTVSTTPLVGRVTAWTAAGLGLLLVAVAGPLISLAGGGATALH